MNTYTQLIVNKVCRELEAEIFRNVLSDSRVRGMFGAHHMKEPALESNYITGIKRFRDQQIYVEPTSIEMRLYLDAVRSGCPINAQLNNVEVCADVTTITGSDGVDYTVNHVVERKSGWFSCFVKDVAVSPNIKTRVTLRPQRFWFGGAAEAFDGLRLTHMQDLQHPNCRCIPAVLTSSKPAEDKMEDVKKRKFYVGSPNAHRAGWAKSTLEEAVKHAKERVEATGEDQFIVKVIKVVRRKAPPIVVEDVK